MGVGCWRLWTLYIHAQFYACADNCRAVVTLRNLAELFGIRSAVFWLWDTFQAESGTAVLVKKKLHRSVCATDNEKGHGFTRAGHQAGYGIAGIHLRVRG